jgi:hypothetical protein
MVTSVVGTEYREDFLQNEYLPIESGLLKPCSPPQLLGEVQRVLSLYEERRRTPQEALIGQKPEPFSSLHAVRRVAC